MAFFWINASPEPKRQHRWYMEFGSASDVDSLNRIVYALKKVTKPEATVSKVTHKYLNHEFHYPGRLTWNEITCDFASVTDPDAARILYKALQQSGYGPPKDPDTSIERATISKAKAGNAIGNTINIIQIDSSGSTIEQFTLHNPFFTKVSFGGDLSYDNEEIVTLSCSIVYDFAQFVVGGGVQAPNDNGPARPTGLSSI